MHDARRCQVGERRGDSDTSLHLQVQRNSHMVDTSEFSTTFHYKVVEGKCKDKHYGKSELAAADSDNRPGVGEACSSPGGCDGDGMGGVDQGN